MSTENTTLKNVIPAGASNATNEMVVGKSNTNQRSLLIVAGSVLALLVWIAVAGTSGGQHLQSSAHEIAKDAVALEDYQVDSANLALATDIFGMDAVSENEEFGLFNPCDPGICSPHCCDPDACIALYPGHCDCSRPCFMFGCCDADYP